MSAEPLHADAARQGMLFGDPLEGLDTDDMGYRGPVACSAAGITYRQLDYWARTGLLQPSIRAARGSGSQRLYSFKDWTRACPSSRSASRWAPCRTGEWTTSPPSRS